MENLTQRDLPGISESYPLLPTANTKRGNSVCFCSHRPAHHILTSMTTRAPLGQLDARLTEERAELVASNGLLDQNERLRAAIAAEEREKFQSEKACCSCEEKGSKEERGLRRPSKSNIFVKTPPTNHKSASIYPITAQQPSPRLEMFSRYGVQQWRGTS